MQHEVLGVVLREVLETSLTLESNQLFHYRALWGIKCMAFRGPSTAHLYIVNTENCSFMVPLKNRFSFKM